MKRHLGLIALVAVSLGAAARDVTGLAVAQGAERPVLQFRIEGRHTESDEAWAKTFGMFKECPGLCDEIWFGTGFGMPTLEKHREYAARIGGASKDVASLGWTASLMFQATIGHGGPFCAGYDYSGRDWTGWTGSTGVEDKYCSCPRDPRFLAYMRAVARIYAANHPASRGLFGFVCAASRRKRPTPCGAKSGANRSRCRFIARAASAASRSRPLASGTAVS